MSRETGRTVAIVNSPGAVAAMRKGMRQAGVATSEIEVAEFVVKARAEVQPRPEMGHWRQSAIGGFAGLGGWITASSFFAEVSGDVLVMGAIGAMLVGAVAGAGVWILTNAPPDILVERRFWKLRLPEASPHAARARAAASRTGRSLHRLISGAFEVVKRN
jgi:hypothetical protein